MKKTTIHSIVETTVLIIGAGVIGWFSGSFLIACLGGFAWGLIVTHFSRLIADE